MLSFSLLPHLLLVSALKWKYNCLKVQMWSVKLKSQSKYSLNSKCPQLCLKANTS